MKRKWVLVAVPLLLLLPALTILQQPKRAPHWDAAVVALIRVTVDGRTVYEGRMNSFTEWGAAQLSTLLARFNSFGFSVDLPPVQMRAGYAGGVMDSALSKSYGWNSTHMWFYITGSFVAESSLTLKWVSLIAYIVGNDLRVISNDTLPDIPVPQGSAFSITIALVWRDGGAFTENMAKAFWIITPEAVTIQVPVRGRDGNNYTIMRTVIPGTITPDEPWFSPRAYEYNAPKMFLIISNRSNPPPPSRLDYDMPEIARYPVSYVHSGKGIAFSATVGFDATEVGLVAQFRDKDGIVREILLMRWVPAQPLKPGTTVRIYLVPP